VNRIPVNFIKNERSVSKVSSRAFRSDGDSYPLDSPQNSLWNDFLEFNKEKKIKKAKDSDTRTSFVTSVQQYR